MSGPSAQCSIRTLDSSTIEVFTFATMAALHPTRLQSLSRKISSRLPGNPVLDLGEPTLVVAGEQGGPSRLWTRVLFHFLGPPAQDIGAAMKVLTDFFVAERFEIVEWSEIPPRSFRH